MKNYGSCSKGDGTPSEMLAPEPSCKRLNYSNKIVITKQSLGIKLYLLACHVTAKGQKVHETYYLFGYDILVENDIGVCSIRVLL